MAEPPKSWFEASILVVIGLVFAIHCWRAGQREFRSGIADGGLVSFARNQSPIGFWVIVLLTFAASVLGMVFVIVGIVMAVGLA